MDETGSRSYLMTGFYNSGVGPSGSATNVIFFSSH